MSKHSKLPRNEFIGEGANGGCFFEIGPGLSQQSAHLKVGWSCVIVHDHDIPITWLTELIQIATSHKAGIAGFLEANNGSESYALRCDPATAK